MRTLALLLMLSAMCVAQTPATDPGTMRQDRRRPHREVPEAGRGVGGAIQSISGDTLTLTTRDGGLATVKIMPDTRILREGQSAKLSDFKAGDRILVRGESTGNNTWKAEMIGTPRMIGQDSPVPAGTQGGFGGSGRERLREGLGKEFIAGEVKSIEGIKLTVHGPDGRDYTAQVGENTSFRRGRESIAFSQIKAGDRVMGRGKLNSAGVFVPETLNVEVGFAAGGRGRQIPPPAPPKP